MDKITCPVPLLSDIIVRRNGYILHPERYFINKSVVRNVIIRLGVDTNINSIDELSDTWISFFTRYARKLRLTVEILEPVKKIGLLPLIRYKLPPSLTTNLTDEMFDTLMSSFGKPWAIGKKPPSWLFYLFRLNIPVGNNRLKKLEYCTCDTDVFSDNIYESFVKPASLISSKSKYEKIIYHYWTKLNGNIYPMDKLGLDDNWITTYVTNLIANNRTPHGITEIRIIQQWICSSDNPDESDKRIDLLKRLIESNGNNLKICNTEILAKLKDDSVSIISSSFSANVPIKDFGILADLYGDSIPRQHIIDFVKVGDLDTLPQNQVPRLTDRLIFHSVLSRPDAVDQLKKLLISDNDLMWWMESILTTFNQPQLVVITKVLLSILLDSSTKIRTNVYNTHLMITMLNSIVRYDIDHWANLIPELAEVIKFNPVTVSRVMSSQRFNHKFVEHIPVTSFTELDIVSIICNTDNYIRFNFKGRVIEENSKRTSIDEILSVESLYDIIVNKKKYEYLMDIEDGNLQRKIIDYIIDDNPTLFTKPKIRLFERLKYILSTSIRKISGKRR